MSTAILATEVASGLPFQDPADKVGRQPGEMDQIADVVVSDAVTNRNFGHRARFALVALRGSTVLGTWLRQTLVRLWLQRDGSGDYLLTTIDIAHVGLGVAVRSGTRCSCAFTGVDRKWLGHGRNDAIGPKGDIGRAIQPALIWET